MEYTEEELRSIANYQYQFAWPYAEFLIEHGSVKTLSEIFRRYGSFYGIKEYFLPFIKASYELNHLIDDPRAAAHRTWFHTIISDLEYEEEQSAKRRYTPEQVEEITKRPIRSNVRYSGYLYVLRAVLPDNYYKIGLSKTPVTRIKSLGVNLPFPIEPLHVFPTNDMYGCERYLHNRFTEKRVNGEWFQLEQGDLDYLLALSELNAEDCQ